MANNKKDGSSEQLAKQAQASARDLGLTISSRCKIEVPQPPEDDDDEL
jgi:hypothetical protein